MMYVVYTVVVIKLLITIGIMQAKRMYRIEREDYIRLFFLFYEFMQGEL